MRTIIAVLALGAVAAAATPQDRNAREAAEAAKTQAALDKELAGLTPGRPQSCLNTFETRDSSTRSFGESLVYRKIGSTRYLTKTTGCTGIGGNGDNILVVKVPSTQICRGDIATTVDRTSRFQTGSCSFGDFIPYRK